ncbi:MAG: hypothetical protein UIM53_03030 [Acutalibacteraceae bacterium]|nr:hypothetical protein [Acutalibacteraceae bacterium]
MAILIPLTIVVLLLCLAVDAREITSTITSTNKFLEEHNQTRGTVIDRNVHTIYVYPGASSRIYDMKILFQDEDVRYTIKYIVDRDDYNNTDIGDVVDVKDHWTIKEYKIVKAD